MNTRLQELINKKDTTIAIVQSLKNYIEINPNQESQTLIPNNYSYIGGKPYLEKNEKYPKDSKGNNLQLLIQINFEGLDVDNATGLLQVFINPYQSSWGMNPSNPNYQENYRVKYYPKIKEKNIVTDLSFLDDEINNPDYNSFFRNGFQLMNIDFVAKKMAVTISDYHFELILPELNYFENPQGYQEYENKTLNSGHRIGGYPNFKDSDPRLNQIFADYVLLLQIDSFDPYWSWGNYGIANFLIHPDDFVRQDYSKVLFFWSD